MHGSIELERTYTTIITYGSVEVAISESTPGKIHDHDEGLWRYYWKELLGWKKLEQTKQTEWEETEDTNKYVINIDADLHPQNVRISGF